MNKKGIIVARVSTPDQEKYGLSLGEIQIPAMLEYAKRNNIEVSEKDIFQFSETADSKIRVKFNEIIRYVQEHPELKCVITYRVDRATRNYRDAVLFDDFRVEYDKELHFVYDRLVLTKDTIGKDITEWDTKVFLAKQVINRLKEDAKITRQVKLDSGQFPGPAPFGYKNVRLLNNKAWAEPDGINATIVKKLFEWYASGKYSMEGLCQEVKKEFGVKILKGKVDFILANPVYCGIMRTKEGKDYPHYYEHLIKREVFDKVQLVKDGHQKKPFKYAGLPHLYRGLLRCAHCGCSITPEHKKKVKITYYHCTGYKEGQHDLPWVTESEITEQLGLFFSKMEMPPEVLRQLKDTLRAAHKDKIAFHDSLVSQYETEAKKYKTRIENMYEDKLDGKIDQQDYDSKKELYEQKIKEFELKLQQLDSANREYYLTAESILAFAQNAKLLFENSELVERREILKLVFQNLTLDGKKVLYEATKPFDTLFFYGDRQSWLPG